VDRWKERRRNKIIKITEVKRKSKKGQKAQKTISKTGRKKGRWLEMEEMYRDVDRKRGRS
jgi:hypothetical protein